MEEEISQEISRLRKRQREIEEELEDVRLKQRRVRREKSLTWHSSVDSPPEGKLKYLGRRKSSSALTPKNDEPYFDQQCRLHFGDDPKENCKALRRAFRSQKTHTRRELAYFSRCAQILMCDDPTRKIRLRRNDKRFEKLSLEEDEAESSTKL